MSDGAPISTLAANLRAGRKQFMAWCGLPESGVPEIMVREGFDTALLDMQHGSYDVASAIAGITACAAAGKPALVRIPVGEFALASRMLDAGAAGVVAPMINSVDDAKAFASFMKYPPMGDRSWGPARALGLTGMAPADYLKGANGFTLAIAMIETRQALDALGGILDVPGIDGILIGPGDLSIALTNGAKLDPDGPEVDRELDAIAKACADRGKLATIFCSGPERARALAARGYCLMSIGTDQMLIRAAAKAQLAIARG